MLLQRPIYARIATVLNDCHIAPTANRTLQGPAPLISVPQCPLTFVGYRSPDSFSLCASLCAKTNFPPFCQRLVLD